jgi:diguanylate cyclase (GGDEF)-like protein
VVALADLDGFKQVNDDLGHNSGDEVLRDLASQLRQLVRAQDYASRWGGDEFLLLLPDTDLGGGATLAEKIRTEIAHRGLQTGRGRWRLTLSFGLAEGDGERSADHLLHEADRALHAAKAAGRNRIERG